MKSALHTLSGILFSENQDNEGMIFLNNQKMQKLIREKLYPFKEIVLKMFYIWSAF